MLSPAGNGAGSQRAFLRIGGVSIARQQVALALALQCERIVCVAPALSTEMVELQHQAEKGGAQFHVIAGPRPLAGLVTANDELIVLDDGLFASSEEAWNLLVEGQVVLMQPVEQGLAAGFERIDINHASAGAMRLPGRLVERLADLPSDCDPSSALLRIALQAGIRQKLIPPPGQGGLFWTLVRSDEEAHAIEPLWVRQRTQDENQHGFSYSLSLAAVRGFGPALLHAGSNAMVVVLAALVTVLIALGFGWFGFTAIALGLTGFGWILRECAALLGRLETDIVAPRRGFDNLKVYAWLVDGTLVALLAWQEQQAGSPPLPERLFASFMLIAMLRVVSSLPMRVIGSWVSDRSLIAFCLLGASLAGAGVIAVQLTAVLLASFAILFLGRTKQIT